MKTFVAVFVSLIIALFYNLAQAETKYTYEVKTGDIGTIKTVAKTKSSAFIAAGNECFDKRVALFEKHRGAISESRMIEIADSCANLKW